MSIHKIVVVRTALIITSAALGLFGCGNKGDLYLESKVTLPPMVVSDTDDATITSAPADGLLDELEAEEAAEKKTGQQVTPENETTTEP